MGLDTTKPVFSVWTFWQSETQTTVSSTTETSYKIENLRVASLDMILYNKHITKVLIRLHRCTGWFAPLLFANSIDRFSSFVEANIICSLMRQDMSSGFPTKLGSIQHPQLQRLARKMKVLVASLDIILFYEQQRCWSDCADAQAGLRLCCSQIPDRFSPVEAKIILANVCIKLYCIWIVCPITKDIEFWTWVVSSYERGTCIKGLFWPPLEPKTEVAFHQFHLIGLLEE